MSKQTRSHDETKVLGIPERVWVNSLIALAIGIFIIFLSHLLEGIWEEVIRDIGIAFPVAGIVSVIYEYSTRTTEEHLKITSILGTAMSAYVTEEIWNEVNAEVFHRNVIRRNYDMKLTITRHDALPVNQMVLCMEAGYDLYGLKTGPLKIDATHYLDEHMRIKGINLPRFESVEVTEYKLNGVIIKPHLKRKFTEAEGLSEIYVTGDGCIKLQGDHGINLPPYRDNLPVRIIIKRHEIINTPGVYTLVMPEMVVPDASVGAEAEPTIKVSIATPFPDGLDPDVYTWFPTHAFNREGYVWTFKGVMLAGQGFSVVFKMKETQ